MASEFDIIVIGAGMAGASVAALLAARRKVLVLERESQPGYHATGRSAALFSLTYGAEPVRALSRASHGFLDQPPAEFSDTPLIRPRGALHVATRRQRARLAAFAGAPDVARRAHLIDGGEAEALCPILAPGRIALGLYEPEAADLDVDALHQGYLRWLRGRGGRLATDAAVSAIARVGDDWRIEAGGETWTAPVLIDAAGAWADEVAALAGVAPIGLTPKRRTAALIDPPPGAAIGGWPMAIDAEERFYFKPDAGALLISPADETPSPPCDAQPEALDVAIAVDRIEKATTLKIARVRHRWAGLRTFAPDRTPVAGYDPDAPGFFWLAGQGGYGIQTAPALASVAAALALGEPLAGSLGEAGVFARDLAPDRFRRPRPGGEETRAQAAP